MPVTPDQFNVTLQENIITLLAYDSENGKLIANLVDTNLFEGEYKTIAERCVNYWRKYGEPPKLHTADLFADILEDQQNRRASTFRRILVAMLELSESINTKYVIQQLRAFTRMQRLKDAILKSAEQLNAQQEVAIEQIEKVWNELLHTSAIDFEPGLYLADPSRLLTYLQYQYAEFTTGIPELDRHNIVPSRGAVMIFLAPAGLGKSWFLVNLGKQGLQQRKKVLHVTLELSEEDIMQRYYQALFSISKRDEDITVTTLDLTRDGRLKGLGEDHIVPDFTFASQYLTEELEAHTTAVGTRLENLLIKRFPTRALTIAGLRGYLDNLEITEKFIPDLLILDYIGIMHTDEKNHRISLGRVFEEFRGLCVERNIAGTTAHQISRAGANAIMSRDVHIAEDWSMVGTADIILTYSRTDAESKHGLARIFVSKARTEQDKFGILITQNYKVGQFVLDSIYLDSKYFQYLEEMEPDSSDAELEDDE